MNESDIHSEPPDQFEHQLVVTERTACSCGTTHEVGDVIYGSSMPFDDPPVDFDPLEVVEELHDVPVEYQHNP